MSVGLPVLETRETKFVYNFALDFYSKRRRFIIESATTPQAECRRASTSVCGMKMVRHITKREKAQIPKAKCVVVVYEDTAIREHAVRFCERLAYEGDSAGTLELNWWSFELLTNPAVASDAVKLAAVADVVVFAMNAGGDLPQDIKIWMEKWLNKRGEREGALVGLLAYGDAPHDEASFREIYLRHLAKRTGMDYLSQSAPTRKGAIPDSLDSFSERAGQMTACLDGILHKHPRVPPMF